MDTPVLGQFLVQVNGFVQARNADSLADWLVLEPPFGAQYHTMIAELQRVYPRGSTDDALEKKCSHVLKAALEGDQGASWSPFVRFMAQYLAYLRNVSADTSRYLDTYYLLSELQGKGNSALGHPSLGHLVLQTVVTNARLVCRLAIGLDRKPELLGALHQSTSEGSETLPEQAANTIRTAFTTALNDRSGSPSGLNPSTNLPEGKKRGIYTLTNLCLKILFQCRKTRNATQIFSQIATNAPPLSAYPKAQRITYLYYLGRFLFQNNHFARASTALQSAYDQSPTAPQCTRQRRLILIYLLSSNLILGRFPSASLLSRPEASGFAEIFLPICHAIKKGDLASLRFHLSLDAPHAPWLLHYRILLQLANRLEPLTARSLARRTFLLAGVSPEAGSKSAAYLSLSALQTAFSFTSSRSPGPSADDDADPDLLGVPGLDPKTDAVALAPTDDLALESVLMGLIEQGLLSGYLARRQRKLAILGAKNTGGNAVLAGFPGVAGVVGRKGGGVGGVVPGWRREVV